MQFILIAFISYVCAGIGIVAFFICSSESDVYFRKICTWSKTMLPSRINKIVLISGVREEFDELTKHTNTNTLRERRGPQTHLGCPLVPLLEGAPTFYPQPHAFPLRHSSCFHSDPCHGSVLSHGFRARFGWVYRESNAGNSSM